MATDADQLASDWKTLSFQTASAAARLDCVTVTSKQDDFVKVDVSNWVRQWRTEPTANIGLYLSTTSGTGTKVAAPDMPAKSADIRPRLSLSCHGDQADPNMVFKAARATTLKAAAQEKVAAAEGGEKREMVNAPWPAGLHDESWLEHANLKDLDWGHKR